MFCSKCGNQNGAGLNFCRQCGTYLEHTSITYLKQDFLEKNKTAQSLSPVNLKDPDELTGKGIGNVFIGDGFLMVAVILSATHSAVSSLLWLFLLIPAFFFFGKGFADILYAKQIRRRLKKSELTDAPQSAELPPSNISFVETIKRHASGEIVPLLSITEKTTRDLK